MYNSGYLSVRVGPMRSGKTSFIKDKATKHADVGDKVIYINSNLDPSDRDVPGGDGVNFTSHSSSSVKFSDKVTMVKAGFLEDVDTSKYDVICIDEGQFFPDLVKIVLEWYLDDNKIVFISSLDGSYLQKPIGDVYLLMPHARSFKKLNAICQFCIRDGHKYKAAQYTILKKRLDESDSSVIKPGRSDEYFSVCTFHYKESI